MEMTDTDNIGRLEIPPPSADKQPEQPADNPAYPQDPAATNPSANKVAGGLDLRL